MATGQGALATAQNAAAYGQGANAAAVNSTALGTNTTVAAGHTNSTAIGVGATTSYDNQVVFGTTSQSYTAPGITSSLSQARQSGPLQLVTTDAAGNLASDNGAVFKGLAQVQAGVAVAMAIETPELSGGQNFGMRMGWGGFDSFEGRSNGFGASAIGVLGRNLFKQGDQLAVDAGIGWGWSEFQGYSVSNVLAGRAGLQFTW